MVDSETKHIIQKRTMDLSQDTGLPRRMRLMRPNGAVGYSSRRQLYEPLKSIKFLIRFPIAGCVQPNKLPQCGGGSTLKKLPSAVCISRAYFQVICFEFTTHVVVVISAHVNTQWGKYFDYSVGAS